MRGQYFYQGKIGYKEIEHDFINWSFKHIIQKLSDVLREYPEVNDVVMQRTDREGILPMGFGPVMVDLLRKDPLSAYRSLDLNTRDFSYVSSDQEPQLVWFDRVFTDKVYLRMRGGNVECPLTGAWRSLAYGEKKGWKIRGEGNSSSKWVPLERLIDVAPEGTEGIQRLSFCVWAQVDLQKLLDMKAPEYYLPRRWNTRSSGWIDREQLEQKLQRLLSEQKGVN